MKALRAAGARIRLIPHGDVSAALVAVTRRARRWTCSRASAARRRGCSPRRRSSAPADRSSAGCGPALDEGERRAALEAGYDLDEVLDTDRLVGGDDVFFAATGVTDGEMLEGVHFIGPEGAATESISMRSRSGTVRTIEARHDRAKLREITAERLG